MPSFPVLQRMDRKRPELIQPISWKAEALKGLASGVMTGLEIAKTVHGIRMQKEQNARNDALYKLEILKGVNSVNMQKAQNERDERLLALKTNESLEKVKAEQLRQQYYEQEYQKEKAKQDAGLYEQSARLQWQQQQAQLKSLAFAEKLNTPGTPENTAWEAAKVLGDKIAFNPLGSIPEVMDYIKFFNTNPEIAAANQEAEGLFSAFGEKDPSAALWMGGITPKAALQQILDALFFLERTSENAKGMDYLHGTGLEIKKPATEDAATTTDAAREYGAKDLVPVKFGTVLGMAQQGYFRDEVAKGFVDQGISDEYIQSFLAHVKFSQPAIDDIMGKVSKLRDEQSSVAPTTEMPLGNISDAASTVMPKPQLVKDRPEEPLPESVDAGVKKNVETGSIGGFEFEVDRGRTFHEWWGDKVSGPIGCEMAGNRIIKDILDGIPYLYPEGVRFFGVPNTKFTTEQIGEQYDYLINELNKLEKHQAQHAKTPGHKDLSDTLGFAVVKLRRVVSDFERAYKMKPISDAEPTTQLGKNLKAVAQGAPEVRGNIDLTKREPVKMQDGSMATVRSISFNDGKHEVLIPTINEDGKVMSDDEAIEHYKKTGKHLGKFKTIAEANAYAERLSQQEGRRIKEKDIREFNSIEEAQAANLPKGTIIKIKGRKATVE